jgi:hypothetical protein
MRDNVSRIHGSVPVTRAAVFGSTALSHPNQRPGSDRKHQRAIATILILLCSEITVQVEYISSVCARGLSVTEVTKTNMTQAGITGNR